MWDSVLRVRVGARWYAIALLTGLVAGLFEQLGWTGFAVPHLRRRYGVLVTGLIVGLVWGAWHLLVVWWGSAETAGSVSMAVDLPVMAFSFLVPYRVLMVWVYDRTESLFLAMGMHASLTASVRIFDPVPISGWSVVAYNLVLGGALWGVTVFVALASSGGGRPFGHQRAGPPGGHRATMNAPRRRGLRTVAARAPLGDRHVYSALCPLRNPT